MPGSSPRLTRKRKRSARMTMHPAVTNGAYDVARIREDFPILAMPVYGKPLVYLDNAASAQKPKAVLDRLYHAYTAEYANVHRGLHYLANAATEAYEGARERVRAFLNASRPEEIVFTRNATEAINLVAYTFGRERIKAGDEIVREVFEDRITYGAPPHRFEAGTPSIVQAIGLGTAIDYISSVGKDRIRAHEQELVAYAHERLREINSLRIIGTAKGKGAIVSFELKGTHPHDVATIIDRAGVAVRARTHCVMPLLKRFSVTATLPTSIPTDNTNPE